MGVIKIRETCGACGSRNTYMDTGTGGYQEADPSRGLPMIETGGQCWCDDCGHVWWD